MAAGQQSQASFDFCHTPHAGSLLQGLQELRSNNLLTDVTLCVSGKEIPCHRNVLAACSEYFHAMFCNGHRESQERKVDIHGVSPDTFQLLVDYMYTSKVTITEDNAVELLEGANFFRIQPVRGACVTFISNNLSAKDCLQMLHLGNMLSCPDLEKKASSCALEEFETVSKTPEILSLTKDQLKTLISSDDLKASEETVYTAVMAWIDHDHEQRKEEMRELMELVRFPFMDKMHFLKNVQTNKAVCTSCQDIVTETLTYQLFPEEVQSPRTRPRRASGLREAVVVMAGKRRRGNTFDDFSKSITMTYSTEPTSTSWIPLTEMKHYAVCVPVAVLGTSDIIISVGKEVLLYQSELNSWSSLAEMNTTRYRNKLAVLHGKVYSIGGNMNGFSGPTLASVEVYDRSQNKWTAGVPLPQPRCQHAAVVLDGSIYVMGGMDGEQKSTSAVYCFSPGDLQWRSLQDMPGKDKYVTATVLNGSIYAGLGSHIFCFTPGKDSGIWSVVASGIPFYFGMTVFGGKVYIYGGCNKNKDSVTQNVLCLDPETQSLNRVGSMPTGLYGHTCVTILKYC
ncbi:kelch-like protein 24 [Branchiostoma floridae]|uniref:Kelch-like protein 24 n=1 Tax=Branchiostoma floridae TaxID=7739 RepID=A0A9J7M937_BRAFL|nr:kelch-like protein 24 [Branchiostoma floridae]